jgi:CubicO group peptidase (beta-lactamase class C family)
MPGKALAVQIETELDAMFGAFIAAEQAPGLVYGLVGPDGLHHSRGFGRRDDSGDVPDLDTIFPIASMSKSFFACAALIARDRGLISLQDPIDKWVPEFRLSDLGIEPDGTPTIEMLFSMSAGLPEDDSWVDPVIDVPMKALLGIVEDGVRLSYPPGSGFEYSNLGYQMGCLAVSRAVGKPIEKFVEQEILRPLGLSSTFTDTSVPHGAAQAAGHSLDLDGNWVPYPVLTSDAFLGASGLVSTVRDLARWVTWLGAAFRPQEQEQEVVLSRMSRREMQRVHIPIQPVLIYSDSGAMRSDMVGYGLGLMTQEDAHRGTLVHHSGGLPGFHLHMRWHPRSGNGVVVLTNSRRGDVAAVAAGALGHALARQRVPSGTLQLWPDTTRLRAKTDSLIRDWSDVLAAEIFSDNVDLERSLGERRKEIEALVDKVGPLLEPRDEPAVISAVTPADVTWSIPGMNGELICMIHLTPVGPARVQEIVVSAGSRTEPRVVRPVDLSGRRTRWGDAFISAQTNVELQL